MRFMNLVKSSENAGIPPKELMDAIGQLAQEEMQSGRMIDMGGLLPSAMGARVRISKGKLTVLDGPFSETKELVGGYAVLQASSREEATEMAKRFMELHQQHWPEWEGECELRQIFDAADLPPG